MKKFTLLLMVAILACLVLTVVVGCGDRNTPQDDNTQTQEPYEPTDEEIQAAIEKYTSELEEGSAIASSPYIIVTLTLAATREFKDYTSEDFKGIGAYTIKWSEENIAKYVKAKLQGLPTEKEYSHINPETYQRRFYVETELHDLKEIVRACILLERNPDIEKARPEYTIPLNLNNGGANPAPVATWLQQINIEEAWALTQGSEDVLVGVMDTGIDGNHPNLDDNLDNTSKHRDFTVQNGENIPLPSPVDDYGHGTHVAGIIAAEGTGDTKGVAPNIRLVSLKVCGFQNATPSNYLAAIEYATNSNTNIRVLNMSIDATYDVPGIYDALAGFNGIIISAAGNENHNFDPDSPPQEPITHYYPQEYDLDNMIVVGNCIINPPMKYIDSNYGKNTVDLFAPGHNINSTVPQTGHPDFSDTSRYKLQTGTSMAAPVVAGVAALLYSYIPDITVEQVKDHILNTVTVCEYLEDYCVTNGMLNAGAALELHAQQKSTALYNAERHYATYVNCTACEGTHTVKEPHTYGAWQYNNGTGHYHTCTECGYTETVAHTYGAWQYSNSTGHYHTCTECGYTEAVAHTYAYISQGSSEHSRTCSICGYSDNESHQLIYINLGIYQGHRSSCAKCSYTLCTEAHTWYYNNHTHINHCMKCNATAQVVPIIQNIEEPE